MSPVNLTPIVYTDGLITLQEAKAYIGGTVLSDTDSDTMVSILIDAATSAILNYPGMQSITIGTVDETRVYPVINTDVLYLDECNSVLSVETADGEPFTQYSSLSGKRTADFIRWINLGETYNGAVYVEGNFGFDEVPEDLKQAARVTVKAWHDRDQSTFVEGINLTGGFYERPKALPAAVLGLIQPYITRGRL